MLHKRFNLNTMLNKLLFETCCHIFSFSQVLIHSVSLTELTGSTATPLPLVLMTVVLECGSLADKC